MPRRTVHLVYPHGNSISAPDSIGRELGRRLEAMYDVVYHDWDSLERVRARSGDVVLGHAHPEPGTCFRASIRSSRWGRRIMLSPFNHDPRQVGFLDPLMKHVDAYLALTGEYWFDSIEHSPFAHWLPKMVRVDMAFDPDQYPPIKQVFGPAGKRRFVYIGHSGWQKSPEYLTEVARLLPNVEIAWIGSGDVPIAGLTALGPADFSTQPARDLVAGFDFLLTVGRYDANPTTILEAMSWGLIPVCTPESGYYRNPGIVNVPSDDAMRAAAILEGLNNLDETRLMEMQRGNWAQVLDHFTWDRFSEQVIAEIESRESRPMGHESVQRWVGLRLSALTSPYSPLRYAAQRMRRRARATKRALVRMMGSR